MNVADFGQVTMQQKQSEYTVMEERIHAASHGAGVILSIAGLWWMLRLSLEASDPWRIVASCVYGASLIALFLTSTLYHGLHTSPLLGGAVAVPGCRCLRADSRRGQALEAKLP